MRRTWKWTAVRLAGLAVGLLLLIASTASAEVVKTPPPVTSANLNSEPQIYMGPATETNGYPMPYNNGYVQHRPFVHLIFWGSDWNSGAPAFAREKLIAMYQTISGSSYASILTQYFDHSGYISNETDLSSFTDTRVAHPGEVQTKDDIRNEIHWAVQNHEGWGATSYENQYVVVTPPKTTVNPNFRCAFHDWEGEPWHISWAYIPWSDANCSTERGLEPWAAQQVSASHEWAESATDPIPYGEFWGWTLQNEGGEIGDLCNTGLASEHVEIASGIFVARLFDDYLYRANNTPCVAQDAGPARFAVSTGQSTIGLHSATLAGTVTPAGWPSTYQFEFTGPGGTSLLPAKFASSGESFGSTGVGATVEGLKGSTTYGVRLNSISKLTEPTRIEIWGAKFAFSGGETQFTTPDWRPTITPEPATDVKAYSATLHSTINPQGTATTYQFEYGKTTGYGTSVPVPAEGIGAGASGVAVSKAIAELAEATVYHFRAVATNSEGTTYGPDREFRTPGKPIVASTETLYANTLEPGITASVNPNGADTHYQFEYGTTTGYGTKIPVPAEDMGSAITPQAVGKSLSGLQRNTTYHYRLVAENEVGTVTGSDTTFTTLPPCKGPEAKCVWSTQTTVEPSPATEDILKGVACPSSGLCVSVGWNADKKNSFVEKWNGTAWQELQTVSGEAKRVACAPGTPFCVGVGTGEGNARSWMIFEYLGSWRVEQVTPPMPGGGTEGILNDVTCSTTACTAVGSYKAAGAYKPLVERWNGSAWSIQSAPNPVEGTAQNAMLSVSCGSTTSCITVGEAAGKPVAESWNGSTWSNLSVPKPAGATGAKLASVSCTQATVCTAVGDSYEKTGTEKTLAENWNGSAWSIQTSPNPAESQGFVNLTGVSCVSTSACTAVGYFASKVEAGMPQEFKTLAESWNGTAWSVQSSPNPSGQKAIGLGSVSCSAATACTAVGQAGPEVTVTGGPSTTLAERWNGTSWAIQTTVNPAYTSEAEFKDVACPGTTLCIAAGRDAYKKNSFVEKWNGTAWQILQSVSGQMSSISCASTTACVAVGNSEGGGSLNSWMIFEYLGSWRVEQVTPPMPGGGSEGFLTDVSCTATACTAVGSYKAEGAYKALVERWNGSAWSIQAAPNPPEGTAQNAMLSVSCGSATSCLTTGEAAGKPAAESWDGNTWSNVPPPTPGGATGAKLAAVSCSAANYCLAVGDSYEKVGTEKTLAERFYNGSWTIFGSPTPAESQGFANLTSVSCLSPNYCLAAGYYASKVETGQPRETKTLVESVNTPTAGGLEWAILPSLSPSPLSSFSGISCSSSIACTAVGGGANVLFGSPKTLAERYE